MQVRGYIQPPMSELKNKPVERSEMLGIHRNTLVYRLQQIERLLSCPIKQRELEIHCALHLITQYEGRVLKDQRD